MSDNDLKQLSLTEALEKKGFTHHPCDVQGKREIKDKYGNVVFKGRARDIWEWLHEL